MAADSAPAALAAMLARMQGRKIVAIDGVDGAGKTTFANTLAPMILSQGKPVLRASIDGFHNPRAHRYTRGRTDPQGYFLDSYNYLAFRSNLIDPFRAGAEAVHVARFNHEKDEEYHVLAAVPQDAVLLIDGIFLHRDELASLWDFSIYLSVPFDETFRRMSLRDGFDPNPLAASNHRYYEGQRIYLERCQPLTRADLVIHWTGAD